MSKLQKILSEEIRRLAHREFNGAVKKLKSQLADIRKELRESRQKIQVLEKALNLPAAPEPVPALLPSASENKKPVRVTSGRIRKWRMKLGCNQKQYAALLGVNVLSVNHWESGKTMPREEQKRKIAWLRDLKKSELAKLMKGQNITPSAKRTAKK